MERPTPEAARQRKAELQARYEDFRNRALALDLTRGKPSPEQLDLSQGLLTVLGPDDFRTENGTDCRNYGGLDGIPEAKRLFAALMEVAPEEVVVAGNSSLNLMHDILLQAMVFGPEPGSTPWGRLDKVRFICPSPGYDRHFAICEHLGMEMVPVAMTDDGPDMDAVEDLARSDERVKGIWCVPKYSNPTGAVYSQDVVERLAAMPAKAADFRIFWDNAYAVHHLTAERPRLRNLLAACKAAGRPDRALMFGSTSKIAFPGAGVGVVAAGRKNIDAILSHMSFQTIGPDKLNQLRHTRFFKGMDAVEAHMEKHAALLRPRFDAVQEVLGRELGGTGLARWSRPKGGYFVSFDAPDGCAKRTVALAAAVGVKLTPAGSTYPCRKDPRDANIRIAPSFCAVSDIRAAMEVLAVSVQLAALDGGGR